MEAQTFQLSGSFFLAAGGIHTDGVAHITEAHLNQARLSNTAVNKGAGCFHNGQILILAMLEHIGRREIARVDNHDLAVAQILLDTHNQFFVIAGLDINDHDLSIAQASQICRYLADMRSSGFAVFQQADLSGVIQQKLEIIIVHGIRGFDQRHFMTLQGQIACYSTSCVSGS